MDTQVKFLPLKEKPSIVQIANDKLCAVNGTNYLGCNMGNNMCVKNINIFLIFIGDCNLKLLDVFYSFFFFFLIPELVNLPRYLNSGFWQLFASALSASPMYSKHILHNDSFYFADLCATY